MNPPFNKNLESQTAQVIRSTAGMAERRKAVALRLRGWRRQVRKGADYFDFQYACGALRELRLHARSLAHLDDGAVVPCKPAAGEPEGVKPPASARDRLEQLARELTQEQAQAGFASVEQRAHECIDLLEAAGMGQPGKPNTLSAMVRELIAERDGMRAQISGWAQSLPWHHRWQWLRDEMVAVAHEGEVVPPELAGITAEVIQPKPAQK